MLRVYFSLNECRIVRRLTCVVYLSRPNSLRMVLKITSHLPVLLAFNSEKLAVLKGFFDCCNFDFGNK
jgi:hypothetical protein